MNQKEENTFLSVQFQCEGLRSGKSNRRTQIHLEERFSFTLIPPVSLSFSSRTIIFTSYEQLLEPDYSKHAPPSTSSKWSVGYVTYALPGKTRIQKRRHTYLRVDPGRGVVVKIPLGSRNVQGARCSLRMPTGQYLVFLPPTSTSSPPSAKMLLLLRLSLHTLTDYSTNTILVEHSLTKVELNKPYLQISRLLLFIFLVTKPCLTLCDPMGYSLPSQSDPVISQARTLECVAIPFSRRSS